MQRNPDKPQAIKFFRDNGNSDDTQNDLWNYIDTMCYRQIHNKELYFYEFIH